MPSAIGRWDLVSSPGWRDKKVITMLPTHLYLRLAGAILLLVLAACSKRRDRQQDRQQEDGAVNANPDDAEAGVDDRDGGPSLSSCAPKLCGGGQRCEEGSSGGTCVNTECSELSCGATEMCAAAAGGGHYCKTIACASDVQCSAAQHCNGTICVDDICEANATRCDGDRVYQCASSGAQEAARFSCAGSSYFTSRCEAPAGRTAGCTCQGDWDCPMFTACNAGVCQGTGVAPACTVPSLPFKTTLPTLEFRWGGESAANPQAAGRAFPDYAQVLTTPVVANLDDDNGDGRINEFDFPEIVFMAYTGIPNAITHSGIVRAVHAGGPKRGQDYFAVCASKRWNSGDPVADASCSAEDGTTRPGGGLAVGDLDGDGAPEIVVPMETGTLQILDNRGRLLAESAKNMPAYGDPAPNDLAWAYPQVALSNLDATGLAEIVVGNLVFTLEKTSAGLRFVDVFSGPPSVPGEQPSQGAQDDDTRHFGPTACPANLIDTDAAQEIVVGTVLYALPKRPAGVSRRSDCAPSDASDFCQGRLRLVWDARVVNGTDFNTGVPYREGFCAVADILASGGVAPDKQTKLDGVPEVVLVSNGRVFILRADNGQLLRRIEVEPDWRGGAPNVDDFDGDGFPEIAMASNAFYTVLDLQDPEPTHCAAWTENLGASAPAPGTNPARTPGEACDNDAQCNAGSVCNKTTQLCVCLHNGWRRMTEDDSSRATSSSVFDFNGDGAAEVVYGDECYFRVYDGATGNVQIAIPSVSRTGMENPLVADVDNDGNAEIVVVTNNKFMRCDQNPLTNPDGSTVVPAQLPNGIQVWGDAHDTWVSARRIWNQHAYHVTNVGESGQIPLREPESWKAYADRVYNTYRSQPRSAGIAPDLALLDMQVSSPDLACGELSDVVNITVLVTNLGDVRVGPGVALTFEADFGAGWVPLQIDGKPLESKLQASLEPGASIIAAVPYTLTSATGKPTRVAAKIDEANTERECKENNNRVERAVEASQGLVDLELTLGEANDDCDNTEVAVTLHNRGAVAASNVLVRLYAGDPSAGGQAFAETTIAGPLEAGSTSTTTVASSTFLDRDIVVYGVADPLGAIKECNNANNVAQGPSLDCSIELF